MLSIGGGHMVIGAQGRDCATPYGFLTDVQVTESADFSQTIGLGTLLFKAPNQQHLMKNLHQCFPIFFDCWRGSADLDFSVSGRVEQSRRASRRSIILVASLRSLTSHLKRACLMLIDQPVPGP